MTNSKHVPKRRFSGFEEAWYLIALEEIAKITMGQSPNGETYSDTPNDYILVQGNADLVEGWVKPRLWTTQITKRADKGDIIMSVRAPAGEVGRTNYDVVIGRGVAAIKGNDFIFQRLIKMNLDGYWKSLSAGSTFESLNSDDIKRAIFKIPSIHEQEYIGRFFETLDSFISLHQHKLDKLKNLKKAYLSEMFPAEGERVPKRRFPGFEGEWEHKKLGQLMDVGSVKRVHQSDWRDRGVRFLRARDIVSESKNKKPDDFLYIDEELYKKYSAISGMVEKGDLLVTGVGTIGVPMLVESSEPLYFKDGNIIWFKNKNLLDGHFFYYSFTARAIQKFIGDVAGVGTVGTYTIDSGKNTLIILPVTKEEQVVIGNFFKKLDQSITLQQQKLDKLNDLKKAYLNELFV